MHTDPTQQHDLAADHPELTARLSQALQADQNETISEMIERIRIMPKLGMKNSRPSKNSPTSSMMVATTPASGMIIRGVP